MLVHGEKCMPCSTYQRTLHVGGLNVIPMNSVVQAVTQIIGV